LPFSLECFAANDNPQSKNTLLEGVDEAVTHSRFLVSWAMHGIDVYELSTNL